MSKKTDAKENRQAIADIAYWEKYGNPLGWNLGGFTYRERCHFYTKDNQYIEFNKYHAALVDKTVQDSIVDYWKSKDISE